MSSDQAAEDGQDPLAPFIIMYASETFDGQERVFTREAYDLHCAAAAHSARCGHPGFVPDEYLNSLVTETTVPAAELCAIGTWERVDGGYRVLDWEAVEVCIDWHARKKRGARIRGPLPGTGNTRPRSWPRRPKRWWQLHRARNAGILQRAPSSWPLDSCPPSGTSGPANGKTCSGSTASPERWRLILKGVATENGYLGDPIDADQAGRITQAFRPPLCFAQVHTAGFYDDAGFCEDCDAPYCYRHWHVSESGYGHCPRRPRQKTRPALVAGLVTSSV